MRTNLTNILKEKSKEYNFPLLNAKLYSQLTENEKLNVNFITQKLETDKAELIYNSEKISPIIITQNHIIISERKIDLAQIEYLKTNSSEQKLVRENFDKMLAKFELTKWNIGLQNGENIEIELKKGKTYYSFYHIMQKLLRTKQYWN
ncbi:hypothetical protein [uncultured Psychroserpens sp.]|uniref:hypothetical protein n=1 Tax=uncultured Psychroserpens sp. TaxID=255436 RepID=UPI002630024B|nr:hypothetical protein [uncultured Psychroserpens sp.]